MGRIVFWLVVIVLLVVATQNHWFDPITNFVNNVKGDIEYQKNYVPESHDTINDGGMLSIEKDEAKVVRRSGLGTVHAGR